MGDITQIDCWIKYNDSQGLRKLFEQINFPWDHERTRHSH